MTAVAETYSILPVLPIVIPAAFSIPLLTLGRRYAAFREWPAVAGLVGSLAVTCIMYAKVVGGGLHALVWHGWLYADALSVLMLFIASVMNLVIVLYSIKYIAREMPEHPADGKRLSLYYGLILWFAAATIWTSTTDSLIMLYVALEANTLTAVYLVAFYGRKKSVEAGYKFLILEAVGVLFSLLGAILLYAASGSIEIFHLSRLGKLAPEIPRTIALLSSAFFIIGFGTKASLIPFHAYAVDAQTAAPIPVCVLLASVMPKLGVYAIARTAFVFTLRYRDVGLCLAIVGSITMILAIMMAFAQDDLKRLLGYSTVSEIGYCTTALGFGSYLGVYGGFFSVVNHVIVKGVLFFGVGVLVYATGTSRISELKTVPKRMALTAFCFFVAAFSSAGIAPLTGFMSEFTIYLAADDANFFWTAIVVISKGFLALSVLVWAAYRVFWAVPEVSAAPGPGLGAAEAPPLMLATILFLTIVCLLFGIYPQALYPLLDSAARGLLANAMVP